MLESLRFLIILPRLHSSPKRDLFLLLLQFCFQNWKLGLHLCESKTNPFLFNKAPSSRPIPLTKKITSVPKRLIYNAFRCKYIYQYDTCSRIAQNAKKNHPFQQSLTKQRICTIPHFYKLAHYQCHNWRATKTYQRNFATRPILKSKSKINYWIKNLNTTSKCHLDSPTK
jgi:hypothetical protein